MELNLPILEQLSQCNNILVAGMGGGFDIFAGLPLYYELTYQHKKNVHLFNFSFTNLAEAETTNVICDLKNHLYGFNGDVVKVPIRKELKYFPEGYLAQWLKAASPGAPVGSVWATPKAGVIPVQKALTHLTETLKLDAIILVDGGVDSLAHGDEEGCGTILEDSVSLAAVSNLNVKVKILAAIGFGTELDDGVNHYRILENMATLSMANAFYGSCSLTKKHEALVYLKGVYTHAVSGSERAVSHITPRILAGVAGVFGGENQVFHSILMGIYWFFDANAVVMQNKVIDKMFMATSTWTDVMMAFRQKLPFLKKRKNEPFPY